MTIICCETLLSSAAVRSRLTASTSTTFCSVKPGPMPPRKTPDQSSSAFHGDEDSSGLVLPEEIGEDQEEKEHDNLFFEQDALDKNKEGDEEESHVIQTSSIFFDEDLTISGLAPQNTWCNSTDSQILKDLYHKACEALKVIPCGKFLRDADQRRLVLNNQGIDSLGVKAVCLSLVGNLTIRELYLKGCRMDTEGMKCLADMLMTNPAIKVLDVSNNDLGTVGANILSDVIAVSETLERIRASSNNFGVQASQFIGQALERNSSLLVLDLSNNHFEAKSGVFLGQGLSKNYSLHTLDISYNHLNEAGIRGLALALKEGTVLRSLNLSWNGVGKTGAAQLGIAFSQNTHLVSLNLAGCRIPIDGVVDFLKRLDSNKNLKTVDFSDNPLTSTDSTTLLSVLKSKPNSGIDNIEIKSISVPQTFMNMLEELREIKPTFTVVYGTVLGTKSNHDYTGFDLLSSDPMSILVKFVKAKNMSILDLFDASGTDASYSLSHQLLVEYMQEAGLMLSIAQMDKLLMVLDKDGKGKIMFSELMEAYNSSMERMVKRGMYSRSSFLESHDMPKSTKQSSVHSSHEELEHIPLPSVLPED